MLVSERAERVIMVKAGRIKGKQLSKDGEQVLEVEMKIAEEQFIKIMLR